MSATYANLYACSIGGAAMQLTKCSYSESPVVDDVAGRTETRCTITGEGWIEAVGETELAAALATSISSFGLSGQDIIITGIGSVRTVSILAAQCLHGGPDVQFEISDSDEPAKRFVKFSATAAWGVVKGQVEDVFTLKVEVRADGLRTVTRSGKVIGPGAEAFFRDTVLAEAKAIYPTHAWAFVNYDATTNPYGDLFTYSMRFDELSEHLPSTGDTAVEDGTASKRVDRDEQMRMVTTYNYDLLIIGDPVELQTSLRPTGVVVLKESMEYTRYKGTRVRLEFVVLEGGDGSTLMDFQQTVEADDGLVPHEAVTWPGKAPLLVKADPQPRRWVQRGFAIATGDFADPPDPLFPEHCEGQGRIVYDWLNTVERRTSWAYTFVFPDGSELPENLPDIGRNS